LAEACAGDKKNQLSVSIMLYLCSAGGYRI
jgi:hypothetical protein